MKNFFKQLWRWVRWPLIALLLVYAGIVIYFIPAVNERDRARAAIAYIQAQHITLSDVMGDNLPSVPYEPENDATVAGLDKNNNGIRDDVELAIFKLHPDSARIRAAELQYALALQLMITQVFDSTTWKAAAQEVSRGYACIGDTSPRTNLKTHLQNTDTLTNEVQDLVLDNTIRKNAYNTAYDFTTGYGDLDIYECDIDLSSLPN